MKILLSFSHPRVISNLIYFLSSVEHKKRFSKECIDNSFAFNGDQTFKLQNELKSIMYLKSSLEDLGIHASEVTW